MGKIEYPVRTIEINDFKWNHKVVLPDLQEIHKELSEQKTSRPGFSILNGILYFKNKPFLGKKSTVKNLFFVGISRYTNRRSHKNAQKHINVLAKCFLGRLKERCNRLCFYLFNLSADKLHTSSTSWPFTAFNYPPSNLGRYILGLSLHAHSGKRCYNGSRG